MLLWIGILMVTVAVAKVAVAETVDQEEVVSVDVEMWFGAWVLEDAVVIKRLNKGKELWWRESLNSRSRGL
jgi:hypothetical protein